MKTSNKILAIPVLSIIFLISYSCNNSKVNDFAIVDAVSPSFEISYNLPGNLNSNASQSELGLFAWKEFFALNWRSSWNVDQKRVVADSTWNFATSGAQPDIAVWETYIHRTELRPADGKRTKDLSSGLPHYSFIDSTNINVGPNAIDLDNYWNVLDEDNEIGSAYVFAHENEYEVLYAAKTNLVEYNYTKDNFPTDSLLDAASNRGSNKGVSYFKGLSMGQMCDVDYANSQGLICLPCGDDDGSEGAIEIKLAFRKLDSTKDDASRYMVKEVVVFTENETTKNIDASVENFALIGMHIIHKTANYPAFVFASWEQVDERNNDIQTIGLDTVTVDSISYADVDPHRLNPVIERVITETLRGVNSLVHDKIRSTNPASLWQYYQLIGVQGTPLDYKDRDDDNNYLMANYVIESDLKLTNFHGSFADPFNTEIQNVVFDQQSYNMGGCQGCHGQAQLNFGTDFSFLLDQGAGKPVPEPDLYQTYEQALEAANKHTKLSSKKVNKLKAYINKLNK